jgi:anti-sigma factor RsiW
LFNHSRTNLLGKGYQMKCRKVRKKLSAYQDGELKPQEREEISRHLQTCPYCREQYEELDRIWKRLGGLEQVSPGPWFYRHVVRKINENRQPGLLPSLRHAYQAMGALAVASMLLIIGLAAGNYLGSDLARRELSPSQSASAGVSESPFLASMKVFDPAPPGTFAEGYLRMASREESGSR